MVVMWVTPREVQRPTCEFGLSENLDHRTAASSSRIWQVRGISEVGHTCELRGLRPGQKYHYRVGDEGTGVWSGTASFLARPNGTDWSPRMLVYGDLGAENGVSLPRLVQEAEAGSVDVVLHVGDFAYDFNSEGGRVGQSFMRAIDPLASRFPYMTCVGNHEGGTDDDHVSPLYHYMHRFQMPGVGDFVHGRKGNNVFYSFDVGPAHIVAFSSEVYFWQLWDIKAQFDFLRRDLSSVDRARTPWVITMAHRPMYCSNTDGDDCTKEGSNVRTGLPVLGKRLYALEQLFHEHRVDLALWAHEHSYERTWPVFDNKVLNGTKGPYLDPGATVHIVSGSAGCKEKHDSFGGPRGAWSAVRSSAYGYGRLQVMNATHLYWEQVAAADGAQIDELWLVKEKAGKPPQDAGSHSGSLADSANEVGEVFVDSAAAHAEQLRRERIFARTRGCTERGTTPQNGCAPAAAGLPELVV